MRRLLLLACLLPIAFAAPTARAYRTTQDDPSSGITGPVAWATFPVPYWVNMSASSDLTLAEVTPAIDAAFTTWTQPSCSALTVVDMGPTATRATMGDHVNVVVWEESGWNSMGFPSSAIGVTNTELGSTGGPWTIHGADMHLNGVNFTWVLEGGSTTSNVVDVQSIVAHESGHFMGLLHPCEQGGFGGAPDCGPTPPDPATAPTMYPQYTGEGQRTLEADDIDGICYLYPKTGCEMTRCAAGQMCDGAEGCVAMAGTDAGAGSDGGSSGGDGGGRRRGGCCATAGTVEQGCAGPLISGLALVACVTRRRRRLAGDAG